MKADIASTAAVYCNGAESATTPIRIPLQWCRRRYYRRTMSLHRRFAGVATGCAAMLVLATDRSICVR